LKEEALDRTMWRAHFGRGYGPVVRQTTWMNEHWLAAGWMDQHLILGGGKRFSVHHVCPDWPWGLPDLLYNGHRGSLPSVKHSGCGSDQPLSSSIS
jgi:hypothetical protein